MAPHLRAIVLGQSRFPTPRGNRFKGAMLVAGLLLLFLAHATALFFRIQPAVSLWFPPAGVAISLTLWLGPRGILLTGLASVVMAPYWGSDGWMRLLGLTDMVEPLVAWLLYRRLFRGSLVFQGLSSAIAFLLSAPLAACAASAIVGSLVLFALGRVPSEILTTTIAGWWLGNAIGTVTITPAALLLVTPWLQQWGWLSLPDHSTPDNTAIPSRHRRLEVGILLLLAVYIALLTVQATQVSIFAAFQLSLFSSVPTLWAAARFGVRGSVFVSSFTISVTLLGYFWVYPQAMSQAVLPVNPELLYTHKLSLLLQGAIALVVGAAISERIAVQVTLAEEQLRRTGYQAQAQLAEDLLKLNYQLNEANRQLELRQQEFEALAENSPDIIVRLSPELRYTYANAAYETATGFRSAALIGKTLDDLWQDEAQTGIWKKNLQAVFQTGQTLTDEFSFPAPDGTVHNYQVRIVPEFAQNGSVASVLTVTRDISLLKAVELALRRSNERFQLAAAAVDGVIYDWTAIDNRIERSEGLFKLLGYRPEEVDPAPDWWLAQVHPEDRPLLSQFFADVLLKNPTSEPGRHSLEYRVRHRQGDYIYVLDQCIVIKDATGQGVRVVGSTTNITERKLVVEERARALEREQLVRQELERTSQMKDEFLAIVSHELRSPLNAILGWARLLHDGAGTGSGSRRQLDADKVKQALASIERNAQAQTQLIEDLLDISRIIQGKVRLTLRPLNLAAVIQAAVDAVQPTASAQSIYLQSLIEHSPILVSGDSERLQQVIRNLLSNAVKFTPSGGRVEINLEEVNRPDSGDGKDSDCQGEERSEPGAVFSPDRCAQITVSDTGKGISPDFLPHVFDRFRQADATTTREQGGLGLGLAIVRNLVELHGGAVAVDSAGIGQGATFTVTLPLLMEPSSVDSHQPSAGIADLPSLVDLQVLVVDDEADTRDFLTTALEQFGATTLVAVSAVEALSLLQQHRPDVLLSDIGMPQKDGYALIQAVRSLAPEAGGTIPAAALTAYVREDDRQRTRAAGFQMHLAKPIEPLQLIRAVARLAGR